MQRLIIIILLILPCLGYSNNEITVYEQLKNLNKYWECFEVDDPILSETKFFNNWEDLIQLHLQLVEKKLRKKDVNDLSFSQRQKRSKGLDILSAYWKAKKFPQNTHHSGKVIPYFIDDFNTACAVGHVLRETGGTALAKRIQQENNYAYLEDVNFPELLEWGKESGFTEEELRWIQPSYSAPCFPQEALPYEEDFQNYSAFSSFSNQTSCWYTWTGQSGNVEDPEVRYVGESEKVLWIRDQNDIVLQLGDRRSGKYQIKFNLFVLTGKSAYYNILHQFNPDNIDNEEHAYEVYFDSNGSGRVRADNSTVQTFSFQHDTWLTVVQNIDIDNDLVTLSIDNTIINEWKFTSSDYDSSDGDQKLAGLDFFGVNSGYEYYVGDLIFNDLLGCTSPSSFSIRDNGRNHISIDWEAEAIDEFRTYTGDWVVQWKELGSTNVITEIFETTGCFDINARYIEIHELGKNCYETQCIFRSTKDFESDAPPNITLNNLRPCTTYEIRVANSCSGTTTDYSNWFSAKTTECGNDYYTPNCFSIIGNSQTATISSFQISNYTDTERNCEQMTDLWGSDCAECTDTKDGYEYNATSYIELEQSNTYQFNLGVSPTNFNLEGYARIWIDYNQDLDFDDVGELVFDSGRVPLGVLSDNITVSPSAKLGFTRMRVVFRGDEKPEPCGHFCNGMIEDYNVNISPISSGVAGQIETITTTSNQICSNESFIINVGGNFSNGCGGVENSFVEVNGNIIEFRVKWKTITENNCATVLVPFTISQPVNGLSSGSYTVHIINDETEEITRTQSIEIESCQINECAILNEEILCQDWLKSLLEETNTNGCNTINSPKKVFKSIWNNDEVIVVQNGEDLGIFGGQDWDIYSCSGDKIQYLSSEGVTIYEPDPPTINLSNLRDLDLIELWDCSQPVSNCINNEGNIPCKQFEEGKLIGISSEVNIIDFEVGKVNEGGLLDIFYVGNKVTNSGIDELGILRNEGMGNFSSVQVISHDLEYGSKIELGDMDNDGDLDIVGGSSASNPLLSQNDRIVWFENLGNGEFSSEKPISGLFEAGGIIKLLDTDENGFLDVIVGGSYWGENRIIIFQNFGNSNFIEKIILNNSEATSITTGDLNGDSALDLIFRDRNDGNFYWLENLGGSNYSSKKYILASSSSIVQPIIIDYQKDGLPDIITVDNDFDNNYGEVIIFEHTPSGFAKKVLIPGLKYIRTIATDDLDNDGDIDIVVSDDSYAVYCYENLGNNTFQSQLIYDKDNAQIIKAIDVNNDDFSEILIADYNKIYVYNNLGRDACNENINCILSNEEIFCLPWIRDTLDEHNPEIGNCTIAPDGIQNSYELQRHKNSEGDEVLFIIDQRFADLARGWYYDCDGNLVGTLFNAGFGGKTYKPAYLETYQYSESIWNCSQSIQNCILPECPGNPEEILCLDWLPEILEEASSQYCNTTCIGGAGLSLTKFNYLGNNILRLSKSCGDVTYTFYDGAGNIINECLSYSLTASSDCNQNFLDALTEEVLIWNCGDAIEDCLNNSTTDLTFRIDNTDGGLGLTTQIPITIENFNKVSSFQYTVQVEKSGIAKIKGVVDEGLKDIISFPVNDHTINLAWFDPSGLGVTLDDGSTIFYLEVEFTGGVDECTKIQFSDNPIAFQDVNNNGNFDQVTPITIDAGKCCVSQSSFSKSGKITYENDRLLEGVEVYCNDTDKEVTSDIGFYEFKDNLAGKDYTIKPEKSNIADDIALNIQDNFVIVQYLHGFIELSPYQLIAADVNKDGDVNIIDRGLIEQVAIGARPSLPTSWIFIPKTFKFEEPEDALTKPFPESITIKELSSDKRDQDFIAINMGDINLSGADFLSAESRNSQIVDLIQQNTLITEIDKIITIPFTAKKFNQVSSFQAELHFDKTAFEFIGIESSAINLIINTNNLTKGILTFAWYDEEGNFNGKSYEEKEILFNLKFKPLTNNREVYLELGKTLIPSNAFHPDGEKLSLSINSQLTTNINNLENKIKVFPPQPNPFNQTTIIKFELPNPQEITLKVIDLSGRIVLTKNQLCSSGKNTIELDGINLPHSGIYFFQLLGHDFVYDGKVILIN